MSEVKQNPYCVPFAYAFVTGKTPNDIAAIIRGLREDAGDRGPNNNGRRRPVTLVYGWEYDGIQTALGLKVGAYIQKPGMTLRKWAAVRARWNDATTWLVRISGHMVVYRNGMFYDNRNREGKTPEAFVFGNSRLKSAWQVS
jgi:hypothetical protein